MNAENIFWRDSRFPFIEIRRTIDSICEYKTHSHEGLLSVGAVESGVTYMSCRGEYVLVSEGMLVFFNPEDAHSCNPLNGTGRSYWMMYLNTDWCAGIQRELGVSSGGYVPVEITSIEDYELYGAYLGLSRCLTSGETCEGTDAELICFASEIFEKFCGSETEALLPDFVTEEIGEYIRENPFGDYSLSDLAEKFRQNRFHMLRSFKKNYGQPPISYQMNLRVDAAKKMLKEGMSIADAAQETGFADQSHFHRVFRKYTAATPGEYKSGQ